MKTGFYCWTPGLPPQVVHGSNFWLILRIYRHISIITTSKCVQENIAYQVPLRSEGSDNNYQIFKSYFFKHNKIPWFYYFSSSNPLSLLIFFLSAFLLKRDVKIQLLCLPISLLIPSAPCPLKLVIPLLATNTFRIIVSPPTPTPKKWTLLSLCNISISGYIFCIEIYFA